MKAVGAMKVVVVGAMKVVVVGAMKLVVAMNDDPAARTARTACTASTAHALTTTSSSWYVHGM